MDINQLRAAFTSGCPVEYKVHCQKRMMERNISREDVAYCIMNGEIIEDYPLDDIAGEASFPSCLILCVSDRENSILHLVVGFNGRKMIFISAYRPDNEHWEDDYKTRKEK